MSTHSEYGSNGVLITQDERTSIPEGQSVGQVDQQEGEAHGKVSRCRLLYSHILCILQVLIVSVVQNNQKQEHKDMSVESIVRYIN